MFLDGEREVGAALDGGVVGDDQHLAPRNRADAGDDACARGLVVVQVVGGQRRKLEKGRALVEQAADALAHEELALLGVAPLRALAAAARRLLDAGAQLVGQGAVVGGGGVEGGGLGVELGVDGIHQDSDHWTRTNADERGRRQLPFVAGSCFLCASDADERGRHLPQSHRGTEFSGLLSRCPVETPRRGISAVQSTFSPARARRRSAARSIGASTMRPSRAKAPRPARWCSA